MGSELSEAKERQLLQAIHEVASDKPDEEHSRGADREETRKRKAEEEQEENGEQGGEKRGMLQAVGELLLHSAHSVKEAVLGNGESHVSEGEATHSNSTTPNQSAESKDDVARESILVHTVVYD
ncbi:hypothetical protein GOP47_0014860 [Adiantum capillus-veneris]|uniref:Uncharacterized protein n=1 Tax=Adiantum capillus-veneris TaxID=13818 RepID=A0A9D4UMU5_ADICA|nr:hypothetical protein GOP47_0014860 [Adiantum capillus-veneris]